MPQQPESLWRLAMRRLVRNRTAWLGLAIVAVMTLTSVIGPGLAPYSPRTQNLNAVEQSPSLKHVMGTDALGRDIFSRMLHGARTSLLVLVVVMSLELAFGITLGAASAFFGGWLDTVVMRTVDVLFAFPGTLFALFISATLKQGVLEWLRQNDMVELARSGLVDYLVVFGALSLIGWGGLARLVRAQILALRESDYVLAARAIGASSRRVILRHLLPNALGPVIVAVSLGMGGIIISESTLSFLGLGIQPPNSSWGSIIYETYGLWRTKPLLVLGPALTLAAVVLGFNWLGDALNDALNPRRS